MLNVTLNKNDRLDYTTARAMEEEYLGRGTIFVRLSPVSYIEVNVPNEDIYRIRVVMCRVDLTPPGDRASTYVRRDGDSLGGAGGPGVFRHRRPDPLHRHRRGALGRSCQKTRRIRKGG